MELVPGNDEMRVTSPGVKLTYDDFLLFPDDGKRHELIDGEHYVTPSPNLKHQKVSGDLYLLIRTWLEQHPIGQIYYARSTWSSRDSMSSSLTCCTCRTSARQKY
jgi:Uma2 family endonuclease